MKKLAKYLVLLLVVALLGGILAVAAFAEETTPTPWTPTDDAATADVDESAIFYAVWDSEEAYNNGTAPKVTVSAEAKIALADLNSYGDCYIRAYSDLALEGGTVFSSSTATTIVLDLNGYAASFSKTYVMGSWGNTVGHNFTVKNGTLNSSVQWQIDGINFRAENLVINASRPIGYDADGSIEFVDCTINASGTTSGGVFFIGGYYRTSRPSTLTLRNTDVILSSSKPVFYILNSMSSTSDVDPGADVPSDFTEGATRSWDSFKKWDIYIDGDSSVTAASTVDLFWLEYAGTSVITLQSNYQKPGDDKTLNTEDDVYVDRYTYKSGFKSNIYVADGFTVNANVADVSVPSLNVSAGTNPASVNVNDYCVVSFVKDLDSLTAIETVTTYTADSALYYIVDAEHTWSDPEDVTVTVAGCKTDGLKNIVVSCTDDGCEKKLILSTEVIPATGHTLAGGTCSVCGETPWAPTEGDGIYYAVWESEDDYNALEDPIKTNLDFTAQAENLLTTTDFLSLGSCYIRVYEDMKLGDSSVTLTNNQSVTIELLGNTLTTKNEVLLRPYGANSEAAHLTVMNGNWNAAQIQMNGTSKFTLRNVNLTTGSAIGYESRGTWEFYDSTITSTYTFVFSFGQGPASASFYNTEIISSSSESIFRVWNRAATINFDENCKVTSSVSNTALVRIVTRNDSYQGTANIYVEDGCVFGNSLVSESDSSISWKLNTENSEWVTVNVVEDIENLAAVSSATLYSAGEDISFVVDAAHDWSASTDVIITAPGCETEGLKNIFVNCTDHCDKQLVIATDVTIPATGHTLAGGTCSVCGETPWAPEENSGIYYAVWASKDDYDQFNNPAKTNVDYDEEGQTENSLAPTNLVSITTDYPNAYIVVYADMKIPGNGNTSVFAANANVTFELNGNKLTFPAKTCIGTYNGKEGITVTIENGDVEFGSSQVQVNTKSTLILKNIADLTTYGGFGYDSGGKVEIYNSTWTHKGNTTDTNLACLFWAGNNTDSTSEWKGGMAIYGTEINIVKQFPTVDTSRSALLVASNSTYSYKNFTLTFDAESSINYPFDALTWIFATDTETTKNHQYIYIEEGFKVNGQAIADGFATNGSNSSVVVVEDLATKTEVTSQLYALEADGMYTLTGDAADVAWYVEGNTAGDFQIATKANVTETSAGNLATVTLDDLLALTDGATVKVMQDLWCDFNRVDTKHASDLTFDLNSKTLYFASDWYVAGEKSVDNLTFKNGTINASYLANTSTFMGSFGVLTFDNVELVSDKDDSIAVHLYDDKLVMNNCTINHTGAYAIGIRLTGITQVVEINNTDITATTYGIIKETLAGTNDAYTLNNCNVTANTAFAVYSGTDTADSAVKFILNGGSVTAPTILADTVIKTDGTSNRGYVLNADVMVVLTRGATASSKVISDSDATPNLTVVEGTLDGKLQVNLTLTTNFNVNFYADPSVVTGIVLNGTELTATDYNGLKKYTVPFAAHEAANELTFTVETVFGDFILNYSVLTYAEKLIATSGMSNEAVNLAKASVAYIQKAYAYAATQDSTVVAPDALNDFVTDGIDTAVPGDTLPETLTAAVSKVKFELASGVNLILVIKSGYNGPLTVNGETYNVTANEELKISLRAKDLAKEISVKVDDADQGSFTLAGYVNSVNGKTEAEASAEMKALVQSLYTYARYAGEYASYVESNNGEMN